MDIPESKLNSFKPPVFSPPTNHYHTEQLHVERVMLMKTHEILIRSFCLECGEKIYSTKLKENLNK